MFLFDLRAVYSRSPSPANVDVMPVDVNGKRPVPPCQLVSACYGLALLSLSPLSHTNMSCLDLSSALAVSQSTLFVAVARHSPLLDLESFQALRYTL